MNYPVFIARRYLRTKKRSALVSRITSIAIGGVFVGVMTLVIVLSVINGFETELRSRIASKSYADRILLYGDMPHAVTLRAILESDALLRTTLYDGDSVSVREALYLGTPVIATGNGMRPTGVRLVPMSNSARLRDAIFELLAEPGARHPAAGDGQENIRAVIEFYRELSAGS
jgi:glycosyltransferase involved in cell wall biosynthesis